MSKKLYIGIYSASFVLLVLFGIITGLIIALGIDRQSRAVENWLPGFAVLIIGQFLLIHIVLYFVVLAKMWGAIQDGQTEITVGKAIGFLFIPIFSLYWVFRAWGSFPTEYNKYIERYGLAIPKLSSGVFVAFPLLMLLSALYLPILALPFVFMALISKASDAVNNLNTAAAARFSPPGYQANQFSTYANRGF